MLIQKERTDITSNLKHYRRASEYTQKEFATLLGISERQYQNIEAGTSDGGIRLWQKMAQILNTTIDSLLEQDAEKPNKE